MLIFHDSGAGRVRRALDLLALAGGFVALGMLVAEFGFPLNAATRQWLLGVVRLVLWSVLILDFAALGLAALGTERRRRPWGRLAVQGMLALLLLAEPVLVPGLARPFGGRSETWTVFYLTTLHLAIVGLFARRLLDFNQLLAFAHFSPRALLIASYVALIAAGAALLKLPNATREPLSWLDAFFTSTSAVSVTGLIVVDTATVFTGSGHAILLGLIQLGGLGLMTFTYFFVALFGAGLTLRDRSLLLEYLNEDHVGRVTGTLVAIVAMTLVFEAVGAFLLWWLTPGAGAFVSVFHAVSAFCNAGFSLYSAGLYDPVTRTHVPYQLVIMILIVVGGLGFPVLKNLWDCARTFRRPVRTVRLTTHTRIVMTTTAALLVAGAVLLFALEPSGPAGATVGECALTAVFNSVTARTAGFNTVPIEALAAPTAVVLMVLMFIGGSPAGTAGGIKTTTFAVALLNTLHLLRDAGNDLVAFRRRIPSVVANRAFAVALLGLGWVTATTIVLIVLMPRHPPLDLAFEAVSAFATVGLSRGLTFSLTEPAKIVLMLSMLVGRIGILYVALGMVRRSRPGRIGYPEGNIIIS